MDVCGPMPVTSTGGSKYFCTFLDDYSKLSVAVPIARKSDVREVLKDVLGKWELQTGKRVLTIRSDCEGEYIDGELKKDLQELHKTHELTVPGSPQKNGDAERPNRILLERTRALLAESGLSQNLWAEALVTVNYAINRTPVNAHRRTPWEMFTG
jgi:transposase InsO family protein